MSTASQVTIKYFNLGPTVLAILLSSCCLAAQAQVYALPGEDSRPTIAPMLEDVTPAIVNVSVTGRAQQRRNPFFDDPFFGRFFDIPEEGPIMRRQAAGSGVIVDSQSGYILTNHHVIDGAEEIVITTLDQRQFDAALVGSDDGTDIAVLKIEAEGLLAVDFGDSDELNVGDFVAAIGNPFGLGQTVTTGIVSALGRSGLSVEQYEDFIQTDAAINLGNSGGALVDFNGELMGINTAIISQGGGNVGIGFAIPSNMVRIVMNQLIEHGVVRRGRLGVFVQDNTPELAAALNLTVTDGVIINRVEPRSAADRAGLKARDVVVSIDNTPLNSASQLRNVIGLMQVEEYLSITFVRDGRTKTVRAQIMEFDDQETMVPENVPQLAGAKFQNMPSAHPLFDEVRGVLVASIASGSPATRLGLRQGDVIAAVNRNRVTSVEAFSDAIGAATKPLALDIIRGSARFYLVIQ